MKIHLYGRIFIPEENLPKGFTYASYPVGITIPAKSDKFRVFFSGRDLQSKSHVFWCDFKFDGSTFEILDTATAPVLSPGNAGLFDCDGISVGNVIADGDVLRLYYLGWQLQKSVPWMNTIGLATSKDFGISFQKHSLVPVLDRSSEDPFSMSYPWVRKTDVGFTIWYGSNRIWGAHKSDMEHRLKKAQSKDGIVWKRDAKPIFDVSETQTAFSRPSIIKYDNRDLMLVSIKNEKDIYSIWFGTKVKSGDWDLSQLCIEATGNWDLDYRTYGSFFILGGSLFILYNGNGFGKTGFGILKLEL